MMLFRGVFFGLLRTNVVEERDGAAVSAIKKEV